MGSNIFLPLRYYILKPPFSILSPMFTCLTSHDLATNLLSHPEWSASIHRNRLYFFMPSFPPCLFHKCRNVEKMPLGVSNCYHGPRLMIEEYMFNIELIIQTHTTHMSMHGSAEGHTGYIYRQKNDIQHTKATGCTTKSYGILCICQGVGSMSRWFENTQ